MPLAAAVKGLKVWTKGPIQGMVRTLLFCVVLEVPPPQAARVKARMTRSERSKDPAFALATVGNGDEKEWGVIATS
jgi:hypothetical protein